MQRRFRYGRGTVGVVSGLLGTVGYFVINDLSKEDSIIKGLVRKLPFFKKKYISENTKSYISDSKEECYIVDDISGKKY